MTIKVTISNDEDRVNATIGVQARALQGADATVDDGPLIVLAGGQDATVYVHAGRELIVREITNG